MPPRSRFPVGDKEKAGLAHAFVGMVTHRASDLRAVHAMFNRGILPDDATRAKVIQKLRGLAGNAELGFPAREQAEKCLHALGEPLDAEGGD